MKAQAAEFVEEMLTVLRTRFYQTTSDKQFYQERPRLIKAITYPSWWLNYKGVQAPASLYRRILTTVIAGIQAHAGKIGRFEIYFLHSVQEHMKHHGDEYYQEAKAPRHVSAIVPGALGRIQKRSGQVAGDGGSTTRLLADLHKSIKIGGRPRSKRADSAPDLFGHCSAAAEPQKPLGKFLKPLQNLARSAIPPQTTFEPAPDS